MVCESLSELRRGAEEILIEEELAARVARGDRLVVKAGFDPTAPDLHLGHTVVLNKMRQFQDFGHEVDFPDRRLYWNDRRPVRQVCNTSAAHAEPRLTQTPRLTPIRSSRFSIPTRRDIEFNSRWMGTMDAVGLIELAAKHTVARMLERDDFQKRYKAGSPISMHEFLYPLVQGYDSVALKADVELGGTDQKFNLLGGAALQTSLRSASPRSFSRCRCSRGWTACNKMSKSLGNYIGIADPPDEMFGKLMSISDELMWRYLELLSSRAASRTSQTLQTPCRRRREPPRHQGSAWPRR